MKVIVIGLGSISHRHIENLISLGINDISIFREKGTGNPWNFNEIQKLEQIYKCNPDFIIISNPTNVHSKFLIPLLEKNYNILCEKPLISNITELKSVTNMLSSYTGLAKVAFNLRFHPCIVEIKQILEQNINIGKLYYGKFFVGQYLPDWRPDKNHLKSYSANLELGGGVILDLIHEIDLAEYLIGPCHSNLFSSKGKVSDVTFDSEDLAEIFYKTENNVFVNIHMDYLYRGYARNFIICGSEGNLICDLSLNSYKIISDNNKVLHESIFQGFNRNDMYLSLMQSYINELQLKSISILPTIMENLSVMQTALNSRVS